MGEQIHAWIIDSGATCHMCNDVSKFVKLHNLEKPEDVTLGDGHVVIATGRGVLKNRNRVSKWPKGKELCTARCSLCSKLIV